MHDRPTENLPLGDPNTVKERSLLDNCKKSGQVQESNSFNNKIVKPKTGVRGGRMDVSNRSKGAWNMGFFSVS